MQTPTVVDLESRIGGWYPSPVSVVPIARIAASVPRPTPIERVAMHLVIVPSVGRSPHVVDYVEHPLSEHHVVHVRPGQVHQWVFSGADDARPAPFDGDVVLIRPEVVPPFLGDRLIETTVAELSTHDAEVMQAALELVRLEAAHGSDAADRRGVRVAAATAVLEIVVRGAPVAHTENTQLVHAFRALVEREYRHGRSIEWCARHLSVSTRTLHRVCLDATGQTPKRLVDERRALEARRLLGHTSLTVAAIARELGFADAANFSRFFDRTAGITAGAFRRSLAQGSSEHPVRYGTMTR